MEKIDVRIPKEQKELFKKICAQNGASMSSLIKIWIDKYVKENK